MGERLLKPSDGHGGSIVGLFLHRCAPLPGLGFYRKADLCAVTEPSLTTGFSCSWKVLFLKFADHRLVDHCPPLDAYFCK